MGNEAAHGEAGFPVCLVSVVVVVWLDGRLARSIPCVSKKENERHINVAECVCVRIRIGQRCGDRIVAEMVESGGELPMVA